MVSRLAGNGFEVVVEAGAGDAAMFPDGAYREAGATLAPSFAEVASGADAIVKVQAPSEAERDLLREGSVLIAFLNPLTDQEGVEALSARGVTAFALESVPRITRAQTMDALSSQSTVSGYKSALIAADRLPKFFPMLTTAAGTVPTA